MTLSNSSVQLADGTTLFLDDSHVDRAYQLPSHLGIALDAVGKPNFRLLFYQSDYAQRAARLVAELEPHYSTIDQQAVIDRVGHELAIVPLPFDQGQAAIHWPGQSTTTQSVHTVINGRLHVEMSLTQAEATQLRALLKDDEESIHLTAALGYSTATAPQEVIAQIDMQKIAQALTVQTLNGEPLTGYRLRLLLEALPADAVALVSIGKEQGWSPKELLSQCMPALAPLIAANIATVTVEGLTFDGSSFQLHALHDVKPLNIQLDLRQPRPWRRQWQGDWALAAFYRHAKATGKKDEYFPEVLHIPVVGEAQVIVENRLTLTEETVRAVQVKLRYQRLGTLEKHYTEWRFTPHQPATRRQAIPVIAYTPFSYEYMVQLEVAPVDQEALSEHFPRHPVWQKSDQPLLEIGADDLPYTWVYAAAESGVFERIGCAEIEFTAANDENRQPLARAQLHAKQTRQWLLIRSQPREKEQKLLWRTKLFQDPLAASTPLVGEWQPVAGRAATVTLWDVYPRTPIRVPIQFTKGQTPAIQSVVIALRSGSDSGQNEDQERRYTFTESSSQLALLWPESIFTRGYRYRIGVIWGNDEQIDEVINWQPWQQGKEEAIHVNAEHDFYSRYTIDITLDAPWADHLSPDATSKAGSAIFAEVHLAALDADDTQSTTFSFDRDNRHAHFSWAFRGPKGVGTYEYKVHLLSAAGHLHQLGPFRSTKAQLQLQIYRKLVSDNAPPEFGVREVDATP